MQWGGVSCENYIIVVSIYWFVLCILIYDLNLLLLMLCFVENLKFACFVTYGPVKKNLVTVKHSVIY